LSDTEACRRFVGSLTGELAACHDPGMRSPSTRALTLLACLATATTACKGGADGSGAAGTTSGSAGTTGTTGVAGSSGAAGTTGVAGTTGAAGTSSAAGTAGGAGTTGSAGTIGAAGTTGSAGTTSSAGRGGSNAGGGTNGSGGTGTGSGCAGALFCDDFESYTAGQAQGGSWTKTMSSGATVTVDTMQFRSGGKSVKFAVPSSSSSKTAYIRLAAALVFPAAANGFYGRMMVRLESAPTTSVHWTILEGSGLVPGQNYHALYRYGGQHPVMNGSTFVGNQWMANYETPDSYSGTGPSTDCWLHANKVVIPVGTWSCVEWQFDGPTNSMHFWLDGAAVSSLTVNGVGQGCGNGQPATYPWTAPKFDRLDLGWEAYQQDAARNLWIDDVAVSTTKIGCP